MNPFPFGWTSEPIYGTGVQIVRNRYIGAMDLMTDDGFGNLVPADSREALVFFGSQAH